MKSYDAHKTRAAARARTLSTTGRDIGPLPPCVNPSRRLEAAHSFKRFCETYFPEIFSIPWSPDHHKVIAKIEAAVRHGGLFAVAMPRGSGKTSLCKTACLWATLLGYRDFVALIGSCEAHAEALLHDIKLQLETNPLLAEDFPEVCTPIRKLDGIANRCRGQLYLGQRTHIEWTADKIVLPTIPGSQASGAILTVAGITGHIRGMTHQRPDGKIARPSLVIIDDPQTDDSARSPSQCAQREAIVAGAILGLAGPRRKIAGIMPCTVIHPGDMADNILNPEKHPEWNGERLKLLYALPKNTALWERYAAIRAESLRAGNRGEEATAFYRQHRKAMDDGAVAAWRERFHPDEISAIQHAMNLKLQDEAAFWSEYQNEPQTPTDTVPPLASLTYHTPPKGLAPADASTITAFIDVHKPLLYYAVIAWTPSMRGYIIDYGSYPHNHGYYRLNNARNTIERAFSGVPLESAIYQALNALINQLARPWPQENDAQLSPERILIDANWGDMTDTVYAFCRDSPHAALLTPSHGRYVGPAATPISQYRRKPGEKTGPNWRMPPPTPGRSVRHIIFDANAWKTLVIRRLTAPPGDPTAITIYPAPDDHRLLLDHIHAETPIETTAQGRTLTIWKQKPNQDNHLFDCLVGATLAASVAGLLIRLSQTTPPRRKLSEIYRKKYAR